MEEAEISPHHEGGKLGIRRRVRFIYEPGMTVRSELTRRNVASHPFTRAQ